MKGYVGCAECIYWNRSLGNGNGKNLCKNKGFYRYMKKSYGLDSRRWFLCRHYCDFCVVRIKNEKAA